MSTPDYGDPSAPRHDAVVTLWFVTTADPGAVIAKQPRADRGFGRKLLAQLNPRWPITPIGQFSLNRSAQASPHEFYIAGFEGLSIIQTGVADATNLSELNPKLRSCIPAADVYAFAINKETGLGAFAHWTGDTLRRSFSARRERVYEDLGLPDPFENPYWAGEKAEDTGGITLPFWPIELVHEAQRQWLGFDVENASDINVAAFAVDGRPEPKLVDHPSDQKKSIQSLVTTASSKLGLGESRNDYDDYEQHGSEPPVTAELARYAEVSKDVAQHLAVAAGKKIRTFSRKLAEKLRHTDRP